jgi:hypothetical protein
MPHPQRCRATAMSRYEQRAGAPRAPLRLFRSRTPLADAITPFSMAFRLPPFFASLIIDAD